MGVRQASFFGGGDREAGVDLVEDTKVTGL